MHELLVVDLHPSVAVGVELLEGLGDLLDHDARAHKAVERDPAGGGGTMVTLARPSALMKTYPKRGDRSARVTTKVRNVEGRGFGIGDRRRGAREEGRANGGLPYLASTRCRSCGERLYPN